MKKSLRVTLGGTLTTIGVIFFILPGSMLVLIIGLMMLSYDLPKARSCLRWCQQSMSKSARRLDAFLLNRKFKS